MHVSGILVLTRSHDVDDCVQGLRALPGVEVRYAQPGTGRIVVVQESATLEQQEDGLRRIQALPRVVSAFLVQHVIDPDPLDAVPAREESPS